jgi:hypothetical protein
MSPAGSGIPKVSFGVPVYNGAGLLPRALNSLLAQTFTDFEIVVSDNASTDGSGDIAESYARRDPRIRVVRQSANLGAARNFNDVFRQARGQYFKWMAHDDVLAQDYLEVCSGMLDRNPGAVLACTATALVNDDGSTLPFDAGLGAYVDRYGKPWYWPTQPEPNDDGDVVRRFRSLVQRNAWCLEVFGLIRSDALRRSSLIGAYYGSDKILLAELATIGSFTRTPRQLFLRGCQPGQSSYLTPQQQAAWIRGRRQRVSFDQGLMLVNLLRAAWRRELSVPQRLACTLIVTRQATKGDKLRRLLVPGPQNYFGIGSSTARP